MKRKLIAAIMVSAITLAHADSHIDIIVKSVDLSEAGLDKNTLCYGVSFGYTSDIGDPGDFQIRGDFQLVAGKGSETEDDGIKSLNHYFEYTMSLGPSYEINENISIYLVPRIGYLGYLPDFNLDSEGLSGYLVEGVAGIDFSKGRFRASLFVGSGKRTVNSYDYTSSEFGLQIGWSF
jgi:hypothetical protein